MVSEILRQICHDTLLEEEAGESMFVCLPCIGDSWLKERSSQRAVPRVCSSCGTSTMAALTATKIAETIKDKLLEHFSIDPGLYPGYEMTLSQIIGFAIRCDSQAVCDAVAERLVDRDADEGSFYFHGQEYCRTPSQFESEEAKRWWAEGEWSRVATELVHGRRFFNVKARAFFESLMVEAMPPDSTSPVSKVIPENTRFYRARVAATQAQIQQFQQKPSEELGAPPKDRAANNRMSPAGVPLLYVATEAQTSVAEVRPSIGDKVVVAEFVSTRDLKVFDFTALTELHHTEISWFNPLYRKRTDHRLLLEYLHDLIARPVRATDTDYVMTQALAEFIRYYRDQMFDGIAFRSVQREGGVNFVIFDRSTSGELQSPDWKPQFDLELSQVKPSVFEIARVNYDMADTSTNGSV